MDKGEIGQIQKYCEEMPPIINELETKYAKERERERKKERKKERKNGQRSREQSRRREKERSTPETQEVTTDDVITRYGDDAMVNRFVGEMKKLVEDGQKSAGEATRKEAISSLKSKESEKREKREEGEKRERRGREEGEKREKERRRRRKAEKG
jgi:hypothetical protein